MLTKFVCGLVDSCRCEKINTLFIFTMGQFYSRTGDWNKAAEYYIRSYDKDPANWMPAPLAHIPDSLSKAGRHEEALKWCERIMTRYAGNHHVTTLIARKKKEITQVMQSKNQGAVAKESAK